MTITHQITQTRTQDRIWGGTEPLKSGLFGPHPLNPPTKTPFWHTLWQKWTIYQIFFGGGASPPHPLATGLKLLLFLSTLAHNTFTWKLLKIHSVSIS